MALSTTLIRTVLAASTSSTTSQTFKNTVTSLLIIESHCRPVVLNVVLPADCLYVSCEGTPKVCKTPAQCKHR